MAKKKTDSEPLFSGAVHIVTDATPQDFDTSGKQVLVVGAAYRNHLDALAMFFAGTAFYGQWRDAANPQDDFHRFKGRIFTTLPLEHPRIETLELEAVGTEAEMAGVLAKSLGASEIVFCV